MQGTILWYENCCSCGYLPFLTIFYGSRTVTSSSKHRYRRVALLRSFFATSILYALHDSLTAKLPNTAVMQVRLRSMLSRRQLPPGKWVQLDKLERSNRCFLLEHTERVGTIFKALAWEEPWICVVGLSLGRRLLREHATALAPITLNLAPLFPKGFLRQMEGETHRQYRTALSRAIQPDDLTACESELAGHAAKHLAAHADGGETGPDAYILVLNAIASGMLIRLFFGARPGTDLFDRLMAGYNRLGPYGLVWNIGPNQKEAFAEIRDLLLDAHDGVDGAESESILGRLRVNNAVDETLLGNLIYMVEMGRYDTHGLFRWLTKYVADNPQMLERIAREAESAPSGNRSFVRAFVLETLRMDQSERLLRKIKKDFVFEGYLFPKGATVRVCLWESHKSERAFDEPMRFDPERFLEGDPDYDAFSPFGLDRHQCPLSDMAIRTSEIFLRQLASGYEVLPSGDGLPIRGAYHWEPASRFSVRLRSRAPIQRGFNHEC